MQTTDTNVGRGVSPYRIVTWLNRQILSIYFVTTT